MKATLKFKLPKEYKEHLAAVKGTDLACILHEITYNIRRKYLKYADLSEAEYNIAEKIFDDIGDASDINIDELI